jgi:hypothetical protein
VQKRTAQVRFCTIVTVPVAAAVTSALARDGHPAGDDGAWQVGRQKRFLT